MRRLILLLDGTWNDADLSPADTNIVRLREHISSFLKGRPVAEGATDAKKVVGHTVEGVEHLVFYERGVGTGIWNDQIRGGAFGEGLDLNIRRAYKFLSFYYTPGDQIFVFGFSRGAYTARSLVGYINAAGLLTCASCTPEMEAKAWAYYRTAPYDRLPGDWVALTPFVHDREKLRVSCLAVFDTVGALGIPLPLMQRKNRAMYEFHDVTQSPIVDINLHAVAIDEHREPFSATLWRKPKFKVYRTTIEQVWFCGAHADVGGGYYTAQQREKIPAALDDIALGWMIRRLQFHFDDKFPVEPLSVNEDVGAAPSHEARKFVYRIFPFALRSIGNERVDGYDWFRSAPVSYDRLDDVVGEMVHISVLKRIVAMPGGRPYRPGNFEKILYRLERTYDLTSKDERKLPLVDWDGVVVDPAYAVNFSRNTIEPVVQLNTMAKLRILPIADWDGRMLDRRDPNDLAKAQELIGSAREALAASAPWLWRLRQWFWRH